MKSFRSFIFSLNEDSPSPYVGNWEKEGLNRDQIGHFRHGAEEFQYFKNDYTKIHDNENHEFYISNGLHSKKRYMGDIIRVNKKTQDVNGVLKIGVPYTHDDDDYYIDYSTATEPHFYKEVIPLITEKLGKNLISDFKQSQYAENAWKAEIKRGRTAYVYSKSGIDKNQPIHSENVNNVSWSEIPRVVFPRK